MIVLRTLDGAPKSDLRDFLREEWRAAIGTVSLCSLLPKAFQRDIQELIFVMLALIGM